jgi:hypothetical protein
VGAARAALLQSAAVFARCESKDGP